MSRRSTPAPQRRSRFLTKSLSVGDSLGGESFLLGEIIKPIAGSPTKGVRIQDGETDLEDFDLGLESELEDVKN